MKETLSIMKLMGMEITIGRMEKFIKENGELIKCKAKDSWFGLMERVIKESSSKTSGTEKGFLNGAMVKSTMATGKMESSTDLAFTPTNKARVRKESGLKARDNAGLKGKLPRDKFFN